MRADNDHVDGISVERCKDESKPQQCTAEKWEDAELKISENGNKNNNNVGELFYDTRSGDEWDKENDGKTLERHSCGYSNEKAGKKTRAANGDSVDEVDPVFFMDKNITACDLPEIVVCYKENAYHVVKDICVDEGVPVQEKFLFDEKDSVKCSSNSDKRGSEELIKTDKVAANPVEMKASEDNNIKVDDSEFCNVPKKTNGDGSDESSIESFADAEGTTSNCNQEDLIVTREVKKDSAAQVLSSSEISVEAESDENSKEEVATSANVLTLGDILLREDKQRHLNNNNMDRSQEQSIPRLQDEGEKRKLESTVKTEEPVKTEQKLSSVTTTVPQEANKTLSDHVHQHSNYLTKDSYEEDKHFSRSFGETSFSAAEAVSISGHITYTGPITYSGSLSVRSDASTTSGRSFAFPILQSEWNSSPVRMAKADKRRHKGWRHSFLCCRFS